MEVKEALLARRSIRKFKDEKISDEQIKELLEAAMSAPSACNWQPWKFYVITNEDKLASFRETIGKFGDYKAPLAILVTGNKKASKYYASDCGAATENILLRAVDLGLGALWIAQDQHELRKEATKKLLNLDEDEIPFSLIYIGVPDVHPTPRTQYDENKVIYLK